MSTIPMNNFQRKLNEIRRISRKPVYGEKQVIQGKLIKLYTSNDQDLPPQVEKMAKLHPGVLYAQVKIPNKGIYYLSFTDSPEIVFSQYGDPGFIEGRPVNVIYYDENITNGKISLKASLLESIADTEGSLDIFDLSSLL